MSQRHWIPSLPAVVLIFVTACGLVPTPTPTPLQILQRSVERMREVDTFRAEMNFDIDMTLRGQPLSTTMAAEMELGQGGHIRMVLEMDTPSGPLTLEEIISPEYVYIKLGELGWFRLSSELVEELTGQPLPTTNLDFFRNMFPPEKTPWELYAVESLGSAEVDGVPTEHLSIQVDFQQFLQKLDEEQRAAMQSFAPAGAAGVDFQDMLQRAELKRMEVWIDEEGYQRRQLMEIDYGEMGSATIDMRVFDFNAEIVVEPPQDYQEGLPGLPG